MPKNKESVVLLERIKSAIVQQQHEIEHNKENLLRCTVPCLKEDVKELIEIQEMLEEQQQTCNKSKEKNQGNLELITQLIAQTKLEIDKKNLLIEGILESVDGISPEVKAAQKLMPELEKNLVNLRKRAAELEEELEDELEEEPNLTFNSDSDYVQFFQRRAMSKKIIASMSDGTLEVRSLKC